MNLTKNKSQTFCIRSIKALNIFLARNGISFIAMCWYRIRICAKQTAFSDAFTWNAHISYNVREEQKKMTNTVIFVISLYSVLGSVSINQKLLRADRVTSHVFLFGRSINIQLSSTNKSILKCRTMHKKSH